ncbi:MAG: cysteine peptidase family C39 domain-containing protein [Actinomycetota bacterium]
MVCRNFGRAVSLARVRQVVRTGIDGTSLKGITRGAEELGLAGALGQGVEAKPGGDAASVHLPLGGEPLDRALRRR